MKTVCQFMAWLPLVDSGIRVDGDEGQARNYSLRIRFIIVIDHDTLYLLRVGD
ncbi:MAG: hypothetical protein OXC17_13210 [Aestuariivita sp.]|nr:hypothetical protein [Aestuariivita sp.]MCY4347735.1 hypothetical protein [Aestuariivita sp.]